MDRMQSTHELPRISRRTLIKGAAAVTASGAILRYAPRASAALADSDFYKTTTGVNMREQPTTDSAVIFVIPADAVVGNLGDTKDGWHWVAYNGESGWVSETYLKASSFPTSADSAIAGTATVSTAVNFRSGPATAYSVIDVLATDTEVKYTNTTLGGFRYVQYNGTFGWISDSLLVTGGTSNGSGTEYVANTAVNLRSGPGTSYSVLAVVPSGASVTDYDGVITNDFRGVLYNGQTGWIYQTYLDPASGGGGSKPTSTAFKTTTAVNLRKGPSTSDSVILVVPSGGTVRDTDLVLKNGWRSVSYKGTRGWMSDQYLKQS